MSLFMERIQCLKTAQTPQGDSLLLTTKCPRGSWNSFDRPWKNERQPNLEPPKTITSLSIRSQYFRQYLVNEWKSCFPENLYGLV